MPRRARVAPGGLVYHALNRGNGRNQLFHNPEDYVPTDCVGRANGAPSATEPEGLRRSVNHGTPTGVCGWRRS